MAIVRSLLASGGYSYSGGGSPTHTESFNAGTGSGRILVVITTSSNQRTRSPTYNGVAMTSLVSEEHYGGLHIAYLLNPAGGSNLLSWYSSNLDTVNWFAFILTGVDMTNPIRQKGGNHTDSQTSVTKSIGDCLAGDYIVAGAAVGNTSYTLSWKNSLSQVATQSYGWKGAFAERTLSSNETVSVGYYSSGSTTLLVGGVAFKMSVVAPTVTTQSATNIAQTSCTGNGNITATGGENCTRRGFCYKVGTSGDPTVADSVAYDDGSFGTGAFTKSITGLTAGTNYRVRAYAVNSAGTSYGTTVSVKTLSSFIPRTMWFN